MLQVLRWDDWLPAELTWSVWARRPTDNGGSNFRISGHRLLLLQGLWRGTIDSTFIVTLHVTCIYGILSWTTCFYYDCHWLCLVEEYEFVLWRYFVITISKCDTLCIKAKEAWTNHRLITIFYFIATFFHSAKLGVGLSPLSRGKVSRTQYIRRCLDHSDSVLVDASADCRLVPNNVPCVCIRKNCGHSWDCVGPHVNQKRPWLWTACGAS